MHRSENLALFMCALSENRRSGSLVAYLRLFRNGFITSFVCITYTKDIFRTTWEIVTQSEINETDHPFISLHFSTHVARHLLCTAVVSYLECTLFLASYVKPSQTTVTCLLDSAKTCIA